MHHYSLGNFVEGVSIFLFSFFCWDFCAGQEVSLEDSLMGHNNRFRNSFDVIHYDLSFSLGQKNKSISGNCITTFVAKKAEDTIQLDLHPNLEVKRLQLVSGRNDMPLKYSRIERAICIDLGQQLIPQDTYAILISYAGQPQVAENPPWDGGTVWAYDSLNDSPWLGVACQGDGASLWWPCKDYLGDEPDSMDIRILVPGELVAVSNGKLAGVEQIDLDLGDAGMKEYHWQVSYPINTYNVTYYIGSYVHFQDHYFSKETGDTLNLDYYVLKGNQKKAEEHFEQVKPMLAAYEDLFGPYPFWKDGYALVEAPYWGMEHQSAIAYGNNYQNHRLGFDFIIIHESGHEYWGNAVGIADRGELWIHEAFCTYSEALYLEKTQGKEATQAWIDWQKTLVKFVKPILGPTGVNYDDWPDADMYYKGTWMLHTLRHVVNDDSLWFATLKGFYQDHKFKFVNTQDVINYFSASLGRDLAPFFHAYLDSLKLPLLTLHDTYPSKKAPRTIRGHFQGVPDGFEMPVTLKDGQGKEQRFVFSTQESTHIIPSDWAWEEINLDIDHFFIRLEVNNHGEARP